MTPENSMFHVTVDDGQRRFWLDGPDGLNAMRLREMVRHARGGGSKLRDHQVWAPSCEDALAQVRSFLPGYSFEGAWSAKLAVSAT